MICKEVQVNQTLPLGRRSMQSCSMDEHPNRPAITLFGQSMRLFDGKKDESTWRNLTNNKFWVSNFWILGIYSSNCGEIPDLS